MDEMAMESLSLSLPLSLVIANFHVEYFERRHWKLQSFNLVLLYKCRWYVLHMVSRCGQLTEEFLHLNNMDPNIQFKMETEKDDELPFVDI